MFKRLLNKLTNMDTSIFNVVKKGVFFSFGICFISILILEFYNTYPSSHEIFDAGIILFRTGLMFFVQFFICGIAIDTIKNELN